MNVRKKIRQLPLRLSAGGYILNSGLSKWNADETTAKELQAFAAGTYPFLAKLDPQLFVNALAATEMAVGAAVFVPFVPSVVAGTALTAFSGGLLGLYLRTPGMREEGVGCGAGHRC
jgi:DoxX